MEAVRFFAVAVAGLVLDMAVAWSAARLLGLPLWLAAATGFAVAATMNYVLHELWTFRHGARRLSAGRVLRYAMALAGRWPPGSRPSPRWPRSSVRGRRFSCSWWAQACLSGSTS